MAPGLGLTLGLLVAGDSKVDPQPGIWLPAGSRRAQGLLLRNAPQPSLRRRVLSRHQAPGGVGGQGLCARGSHSLGATGGGGSTRPRSQNVARGRFPRSFRAAPPRAHGACVPGQTRTRTWTHCMLTHAHTHMDMFYMLHIHAHSHTWTHILHTHTHGHTAQSHIHTHSHMDTYMDTFYMLHIHAHAHTWTHTIYTLTHTRPSHSHSYGHYTLTHAHAQAHFHVGTHTLTSSHTCVHTRAHNYLSHIYILTHTFVCTLTHASPLVLKGLVASVPIIIK